MAESSPAERRGTLPAVQIDTTGNRPQTGPTGRSPRHQAAANRTLVAFSIPLIAGGDYQPLGVKIYTVANVFLDWPQASAMAVIMGIIQAGLVIAYQTTERNRRSA